MRFTHSPYWHPTIESDVYKKKTTTTREWREWESFFESGRDGIFPRFRGIGSGRDSFCGVGRERLSSLPCHPLICKSRWIKVSAK